MIFGSQFSRKSAAKLETWVRQYETPSLLMVVYTLLVGLLFLNGFQTQFSEAAALSSRARWLQAVARGSGSVLNALSPFAIMTACRTVCTVISSISGFRKMSIIGTISLLHSITGYTILFAAIVHSVAHLLWILPLPTWEEGMWNVNMTVGTGFALILILLVVCLSVIRSFRKQHYELCKRLHIAGFLMYTIMLMFHGVHHKRPETYKYVIPALITYVLDRIIRRSRTKTCCVQVVVAGKDIMRLSTPKPFEYRAGQYVEIMIGSIGSEWHPFTIASAPFEESLSLYIKKRGDWTELLFRRAQNDVRNSMEISLDVKICGPFGAPAQNAGKYRHLIMISGGIGATPFVSMCKHLSGSANTKAGDTGNKKGASKESIKSPPPVLRLRTGIQDDPIPFEAFDSSRLTEKATPIVSENYLWRFIFHVTTLLKAFVLISGLIFRSGYILVTEDAMSTVRPTGSWLAILNLLLSVPCLFYWTVQACWIFSRLYLGMKCTKKYMTILSAAVSINTTSMILEGLRWWYEFHGGISMVVFQYIVTPVILTICFYLQGTTSVEDVGDISDVKNTIGNNCHWRTERSATCKTEYREGQKIDFIWVTPLYQESAWIERELSCTAQRENICLQRFITRETSNSETENALRSTHKPKSEVSILTDFGRPDWFTVLSKIAQQTENNERIGIHICAPASMGQQIRRAARMVSVVSRLRYAYIRSEDMDKLFLEKRLVHGATVSTLLTHGCNISFLVHEECFF